jgi:BirA family biotin operon repressor/biotin-[acetyl-CoA-carboxylase] ligase
LEILYLDSIDSTHKYLIKKLKAKELAAPIAVTAKQQTSGIGSRGNEWVGMKDNLFLSFCVEKKQLPHDLPIVSSSIYFSYIMKSVLADFGSSVWLKWPNDLYIDKKKLGGTITTKISDDLICSIGVNTVAAPKNFGVLDISIKRETLIERFFLALEKRVSWKDIFSKYRIEFHKSKEFSFHIEGKKSSLKNAVLFEDGSIEIEKKRVYSLR